MLSSKELVVAFLLGVSVTRSYANTLDNDDDELTKKIKERYKTLCNSNLCRENPGKPVKEVFDTEDGYVTIELSCPKDAEQERKCREGYHDNGDKCEDIDECNDGSHKCSKNATCTNTIGSFECVCLAGYHGDGYSCKACGSDWQLYFNGSCYKYFNEKESWDNAKAKCESYGAILASIHSSEENAFITGSIKHMDVWIGLNDKTDEGTFTWIDGTALNYTNWGPGEPNNSRGKEDCVELRVHGGLWNDNKCSNVRYYLCKL